MLINYSTRSLVSYYKHICLHQATNDQSKKIPWVFVEWSYSTDVKPIESTIKKNVFLLKVSSKNGHKREAVWFSFGKVQSQSIFRQLWLWSMGSQERRLEQPAVWNEVYCKNRFLTKCGCLSMFWSWWRTLKVEVGIEACMYRDVSSAYDTQIVLQTMWNPKICKPVSSLSQYFNDPLTILGEYQVCEQCNSLFRYTVSVYWPFNIYIYICLIHSRNHHLEHWWFEEEVASWTMFDSKWWKHCPPCTTNPFMIGKMFNQ